VIVELGANDGLRGLPVTEMKRNLAAIVQASKRDGARVVLVGMQLPPNYGVPYVNQFRAAFGELAKDERVSLVPFLLEGLESREQFQADAIHPTAAAQPMILENVWRRLAPLMVTPVRQP
jgi:acyl-CoA thioesterase-1